MWFLSVAAQKAWRKGRCSRRRQQTKRTRSTGWPQLVCSNKPHELSTKMDKMGMMNPSNVIFQWDIDNYIYTYIYIHIHIHIHIYIYLSIYYIYIYHYRCITGESPHEFHGIPFGIFSSPPRLPPAAGHAKVCLLLGTPMEYDGVTWSGE